MVMIVCSPGCKARNSRDLIFDWNWAGERPIPSFVQFSSGRAFSSLPLFGAHESYLPSNFMARNSGLYLIARSTEDS